MTKNIVLSLFSRLPNQEEGVSPKSYPFDRCNRLVELLKPKYNLQQLGVAGEPTLDVQEFKFNLPFGSIKKLLNECFLFISIDSFLPHLAHSYGIKGKGVVLFAQSDPRIFGYEDNVNMLKNRKYLREWQYRFWNMCDVNDNAFVKPEEILLEVRKRDEN